jgi:hypothetical protein
VNVVYITFHAVIALGVIFVRMEGSPIPGGRNELMKIKWKKN